MYVSHQSTMMYIVFHRQEKTCNKTVLMIKCFASNIPFSVYFTNSCLLPQCLEKNAKQNYMHHSLILELTISFIVQNIPSAAVLAVKSVAATRINHVDQIASSSNETVHNLRRITNNQST